MGTTKRTSRATRKPTKKTTATTKSQRQVRKAITKAAKKVEKSHPGGDTDKPNLWRHGITGLKQTGGRVREEFLTELHGRKGMKVYTEMGANNPMVGAALWLFEAVARQVRWQMSPSDGTDAEALRLAKWFDGALGDMESRWSEVVSESMTMPQYGFFAAEPLFKLRKGDSNEDQFHSKFDDGLWAWRDIAPRAQDSLDRWAFDDEGRVQGMHQLVDVGGGRAFVPIQKLALFRVQSRKKSPEGKSMLRTSYRSYYYMELETDLESVGVERNVTGYPLARIPWECFRADAPSEYQDIMTFATDTVKRLRQDTLLGGVWPSKKMMNGVEVGFDLEFMSTGKNPQDTNEIIKRHRSDIAVALLVEMLLLGSSTTGSWALADKQTSVLAMAVGAILEVISEVFTEVLIPQLGRLNAFDMSKLPTLTYSDIEKQDLTALSDALSTLRGAGLLLGTGEEFDEWIREEFALPTRDVEAKPDAARPGAQPGLPTDGQPEPLADEPPQEDIAEQALNGAQVTALLDVIQRVADGMLPRDAGIDIITNAFPISPQQAEAMMGTIGRGFVPTEEEPREKRRSPRPKKPRARNLSSGRFAPPA